MPNWVNNILDIEGDRAELIRLVEQVGKPVPVKYNTFEKDEAGNVDMVWKEQILTNPVFSFWNIKAPTDLNAYYGDNTEKLDLENFFETFNNAFAKDNSWYYWNVRNWGCKWDVAVGDEGEYATTEFEEKGENWISFKFNTPWSPPIQVITELSKQYPTLDFTLIYEEEQGWGGELNLVNGEEQYHNEYDIPECHANYVERDVAHNCLCDGFDVTKLSTIEEIEDMLDAVYEDCPVFAQGQEKLASLQGTGV